MPNEAVVDKHDKNNNMLRNTKVYTSVNSDYMIMMIKIITTNITLIMMLKIIKANKRKHSQALPNSTIFYSI
jgi:hypothetical protein